MMPLFLMKMLKSKFLIWLPRKLTLEKSS